MTDTALIYMTEMSQLTASARITGMEQEGSRAHLELDRTIFYPQGGGQPCDTGMIRGDGGEVRVVEVRWIDGKVIHAGNVEGKLSTGETVLLEVDGDRRSLNTRLHSAGHVVDMAIDRLGLGWTPGKGYHFPDGPYVEYAGELAGNKETLVERIESEIREILGEGHSTHVDFVDPAELGQRCRVVPAGLPTDGAVRVVSYGDFGVVCGGTHVEQLATIGSIGIRKLKSKGGTTRVSYVVS